MATEGASRASYPPVPSASTPRSPPQRAKPLLSSLSVDSTSLTPSTSTFSHLSETHADNFTASPSVDLSRPHPGARFAGVHHDLPFPSSAFGQQSASSPSTAASARLFKQLEVIKGLQGDIAQQHARLEGISSGGAGENDWVWAVKGTVSVKSGEEGKSPDEEVKQHGDGAAAGVGDKDERDKTAKAYAAMAQEFKERQSGVSEIMGSVSTAVGRVLVRSLTTIAVAQLSTLSVALKAFHALPSPVLFPPEPKTSHSSARGKKQSGGGRAETAPAEETAVRPGRVRRVSYEA